MTDLYRVYPEDGRLLYVGATDDVDERLNWHARYSPWFSYALHVAIEPFETREAAFAAELVAIHSEWPLWNLHASPFRLIAVELRQQERARGWGPFDLTLDERRDRQERYSALVNTNYELVAA